MSATGNKLKDAAARLREEARKLTENASRLREEASKVESVGSDMPSTAKDVIRHFSPPASIVRCENTLPLDAVGMKGFDARKALCRNAGIQLGQHIAQTLDLELARRGDGMVEMENEFLLRTQRAALYRATVHFYTPSELERLVEEAMRVGRSQA